MSPKRFITANRIIVFLILVAIVITILLLNYAPPMSKLVDVELDYWGYDDLLDQTTCDITLIFKDEVYWGTMTVSFADANHTIIDTQTESFYGQNKQVTERFYVYGKAAYYKVEECYVEKIDVDLAITILVWIAVFVFLIFIYTLLLSVKVYHFGGHKIVVYAGWYNHYITFDGEKVDEHNTIVTYSPIYLSCKIDGLYLEAAISLTNRISLKINGRLYNN